MIEAVTLDFYQTLAYHRTGIGRGRSLMRYLEAEGLASDPWEHRVLYAVFEPHAREYDPAAPEGAKHAYRRRLARRLFRRLGVAAPPEEAERRAEALWEILGPPSLAVFDDVPEALSELRRAGYRLAVVSNWQCGLGHFLLELGVAGHFEHVVVSAEVGSEKPDATIFVEACRLLGVEAGRVLHVGDNPVDDVEGGRRAGLQTALLMRDDQPPEGRSGAVASLTDLAAELAV